MDFVSELFEMSKIKVKLLEKDVGEVRTEMAGLNERLGGLERNMSAVTEFMMEIKESLAARGERGKSPLAQSLNQDHPVQTASTTGSCEGAARDHYQQRRLEIPIFSGEDPCGWILKAEKYFTLYGVEEGEKVAYATLCMEGKALNWLLWMEARDPIHGWKMFKDELMQRFQSTKGLSALEQLLSLRQSTSVAHYREQFEFLSAPLLGVPDEMLRCAFINGLNDVLKAEAELAGPTDLVRVMSLAQEIEDRNKVLEKMEKVELTRSFGDYLKPNSLKEMAPIPKTVDPNEVRSYSSNDSALIDSQNPRETGRSSMEFRRGSSVSKTDSKLKEMGGTSREEGGFKRLTEAEFKYRMEMGLCFRCNKKYSESHRCKNKHLLLLLGEDEDEICDQEEIEEESQKELSMNSAWILDSPSFKFPGKIGSRDVIVLVGIAATHNFISKEVAAGLKIPMERTSRFHVELADGSKVEGAEVCKNVVVKMQGIEIVNQRFFPIDLAIADVVLGNEWTRTFGTFTMGPSSTMSFNWLGRTVTLQADSSLTRVKRVKEGGQGYVAAEMGFMMLKWDEED